MLQLKIARASAKLYRGILAISLRSVDKADARNLASLDRKMAFANKLREGAMLVMAQSRDIEVNSNKEYDVNSRKITSAHNELSNLLQDTRIPEVK